MAFLIARTLGEIDGQKAEVVRVDGYPGRCRTLSTVAVRSLSYLGDVVIEGNMSEDADGDWVELAKLSFESCPATLSTNIKGKFVWLRISYEDLMGDLDYATVS